MGAQQVHAANVYQHLGGLADCARVLAAEKAVVDRDKVGQSSPSSHRSKAGELSTRSRISERIKLSERGKAQQLSRRTVQTSHRAQLSARTAQLSARTASYHSSGRTARYERRNTECAACRYLEPVLDEHRIIIIGDLHGMVHKAKALWEALEEALGSQRVLKALVVFLGDYCDRGLYTKELLQWLLALQKHRAERGARTVCLLGNHEFCLLGFLGCLPRPVARPDFQWRQTWDSDNVILSRGERDRWWGRDEDDSVLAEVHLQGRRWAGAVYEKSYGSTATFISYGTARGDRYGLLQSMPEAHRSFLQACPWVHVEENPILGRFIFVHAGLVADGSPDCQAQIDRLQQKTIAAESQPEQLFGREQVLHAPPQLVRQGTNVVSGHHGRLMLKAHRIVLDSCGGDERNLLSALVLPETLLVTQDGSLDPRDPCSVFPTRVRLPQFQLGSATNKSLKGQNDITSSPAALTSKAEGAELNHGNINQAGKQRMPQGDDSPLE